jgi:hypothetical protein
MRTLWAAKGPKTHLARRDALHGASAFWAQAAFDCFGWVDEKFGHAVAPRNCPGVAAKLSPNRRCLGSICAGDDGSSCHHASLNTSSFFCCVTGEIASPDHSRCVILVRFSGFSQEPARRGPAMPLLMKQLGYHRILRRRHQYHQLS